MQQSVPVWVFIFTFYIHFNLKRKAYQLHCINFIKIINAHIVNYRIQNEHIKCNLTNANIIFVQMLQKRNATEKEDNNKCKL